jgi:hypothetical protein
MHKFVTKRNLKFPRVQETISGNDFLNGFLAESIPYRPWHRQGFLGDSEIFNVALSEYVIKKILKGC